MFWGNFYLRELSFADRWKNRKNRKNLNQRPRSSRCSSVQCVHFGSIRRENYSFMASTKKSQAGFKQSALLKWVRAGNYCSQKAENAISNTLYFKIFRGGMPLDPPP